MTSYRIKGRYKFLELDLGVVNVVNNYDLNELKKEILDDYKYEGISEIRLEELKVICPKVIEIEEDVLPFD